MNEILINRTAQLFNVTKTEAMYIIERYMIDGELNALFKLVNLKDGEYNVSV